MAGVVFEMRRLTFWLLVAFTFTIPWEMVTNIGGLGAVSKFVGLAAFASALLTVWLQWGCRRFSSTLIVLSAYVAWSALTTLWTLDPKASYAMLLTYAQLLGSVWLIWEFAPEEYHQERLIWAYVLGTFVSLASIAHSFAAGTGFNMTQDRFSSTGQDPNELALTFALAIPMAWFLYLRRPTARTASFALCCIPALLYGVSLTASRGGLMATIVAASIIPLTLRFLPKLRRGVVVLLMVAAVICVLRAAPASSLKRFSETKTQVTQGDMTLRKDIWKAGLRVLSNGNTLLFGTGIGSYASAVRPILGYGIVAHNTLLSICTETGFIGLSLFLASFATALMFSGRLRSENRMLWMIMLLTWLTGTAGLSWDFRKPTWLLVGLLSAQVNAGLSARRGYRRANACVDRSKLALQLERRNGGTGLEQG